MKNKREVWRVQLTLAKIRKAARELLTLDEKDPRRIFEGAALLRRMYKLGLLNENENKLDYVLGLTVQKFMERRLQTIVLKSNLAKSIHEARVYIRHRHIRYIQLTIISKYRFFRVGKQLVNIPSFMVNVDSEKQIQIAATSPFGGGKAGRTKRKLLRLRGGKKVIYSFLNINLRIFIIG